MMNRILPYTQTRHGLFVTAIVLCITFAGGEGGALAQDKVLSLGTKLDLSLSGYVDTSYTQNFNTPSDGINQMRSFDGDANSFRPNMAQIVLERAAKSQGSWEDRTGFRVKLNVGEDAKFTGGGGEDDFDFQESYLQVALPIGNGIMFQAGRMNTLIGYEVIESPLNPNFSRSFLFGMGEPFTVTGLRASYDFNDRISFAVSAINSFTGLQVDDNHSKSVEALLSYSPMDTLGLSLFGFWGPEGGRNGTVDYFEEGVFNADADGFPVAGSRRNENADRVQVGGIIDWQATDALEFVVEGYYGQQANAVIEPGGSATIVRFPVDDDGNLNLDDGNGRVVINPTHIANARWNGVAAYVLYDFTDRWGLRVRTELFEDAAGFFSCAGGGGNALQCADGFSGEQTLWETTWTLQYRPIEDFITRLEYRYDKSDKASFQDGSAPGNNQSTLAMEAIYLF